MLNSLIKNTGLFVLFLVIQLFLMNNIQFSGYVNPYIYILFIILLPFDIPTWLLLILAFISGLIVDLFSGTPGLHTSASVMAAFMRPYVLSLVAPRDGYELGGSPGIKVYGFRWFLLYVSIIVLIHHFTLFYIEVFSFSYFFRTLARVIVSSLFSIVFIMIIQALLIRR